MPECHDNSLILKYFAELPRGRKSEKIDNFPILLYGDGQSVVDQIIEALRAPLGDKGIIFTPSRTGDVTLSCGVKRQFDFSLDSQSGGMLQITNCPHGGFYGELENQINGQDHSAFLMFQALVAGDTQFKIARLAIAGLGEFIVRNGITARLPFLEMNYIPELKEA